MENFQEFRKEMEAKDDLEGESCTIQECVKGIVSFDHYAEMYARENPNFVGVISVPIEGEKEELYQSLAICKGKVLYHIESVIAGKFSISAVVEIVGIGQDGEKLTLQKVNDSCFLLHAEGNPASPFEFVSKVDAIQMAEMLSILRMEDRLNTEFS